MDRWCLCSKLHLEGLRDGPPEPLDTNKQGIQLHSHVTAFINRDGTSTMSHMAVMYGNTAPPLIVAVCLSVQDGTPSQLQLKIHTSQLDELIYKYHHIHSCCSV